MHYKIGSKLVKSENAAKSIKQPNRNVINFISSIPYDVVALDYGCGKMRYTIPLANKVRKVIAIDSAEQIYRKQNINSQYTSIYNYAYDNMNNVFIYDINSQDWKKHKYDIVFCTNVLSAIPTDDIRVEVLKNIKGCLSSNGYVYLCVQYRNSYFTQYNTRDDIEIFNDGWIIKNKSAYAFYGILPPQKLLDLCKLASLHVYNMYLHDGSVYVMAK